MMWWILGAIGLLLAWVVYDVVQRKHAILHNFPLIGHLRYLLETVGPEFRQYIVTSNDEERPFSRDQRRWIYASSKKENNYFGFGSDNDMELSPNYIIMKHSAFPLSELPHDDPKYDSFYRVPCAKVLGGYRERPKAFRPDSVVNVSGMSFGSLGATAIEALNRGCAIAGCFHNTGEGSVSPYHDKGGDLIWQVGTGYFGCRESTGGFSLSKLTETVDRLPKIRAIEIKLSQGAKPGLGGMLPGAKVTPQIAQIRGIPVGKDCLSPAGHTAFHSVDGLLDFTERIADATGLPVGIKSAVGDMEFWKELTGLMSSTNRVVDFVTIDGGEGGTGAAPLAFSDHVSLPFKMGFTRVFRQFAEAGLHEKVVFNGSGKLGFPESAALAFVLGCDYISVAREAMMAIGCIQAQRCHTGHCPTGVATHNPWLIRGLDPTLKAARLANYVVTLRKELLRLSFACGVPHPALLTGAHCEILDGRFGSSHVEELFGYAEGMSLPSEADQKGIRAIMEKAL